MQDPSTESRSLIASIVQHYRSVFEREWNNAILDNLVSGYLDARTLGALSWFAQNEEDIDRNSGNFVKGPFKGINLSNLVPEVQLSFDGHMQPSNQPRQDYKSYLSSYPNLSIGYNLEHQYPVPNIKESHARVRKSKPVDSEDAGHGFAYYIKDCDARVCTGTHGGVPIVSHNFPIVIGDRGGKDGEFLTLKLYRLLELQSHLSRIEKEPHYEMLDAIPHETISFHLPTMTRDDFAKLEDMHKKRIVDDVTYDAAVKGVLSHLVEVNESLYSELRESYMKEQNGLYLLPSEKVVQDHVVIAPPSSRGIHPITLAPTSGGKSRS